MGNKNDIHARSWYNHIKPIPPAALARRQRRKGGKGPEIIPPLPKRRRKMSYQIK